jgi:hypothetical protein
MMAGLGLLCRGGNADGRRTGNLTIIAGSWHGWSYGDSLCGNARSVCFNHFAEVVRTFVLDDAEEQELRAVLLGSSMEPLVDFFETPVAPLVAPTGQGAVKHADLEVIRSVDVRDGAVFFEKGFDLGEENLVFLFAVSDPTVEIARFPVYVEVHVDPVRLGERHEGADFFHLRIQPEVTASNKKDAEA